MDAQVGERLEEERREMAGIVGMRRTLRRGDVGKRDAHVLLDRIGRQQRLRVHGVEILNAVAELDLRAMLRDRAPDRVVQHDAAQAAHVNGA